MAWAYLNHFLDENTPTYGGYGQMKIERERSMASGDTSNNSSLNMPGHIGTHIDAPYHFCKEGQPLDQYPADFWVAERPALIDFSVEPAELICLDKLLPQLERLDEACDFLFLRSGAEKWRSEDPETYSKKGPGIHPDLAKWLRRRPQLRFIGLDFISVSSFQHRETGREAHRELLAKNPDGILPVLPVEDMALSSLKTAPKRVFVAPLIFDKSDGAPATVLAEVG